MSHAVPVSISAIAVLALGAVSASADSHMEPYNTRDFSIHYPSDWFLMGLQDPETKFSVKESLKLGMSEYNGRITVKNVHMPIDTSHIRALESLVNAEEAACEADENCEKFALSDSEEVCANGKIVYRLSYSQVRDSLKFSVYKSIVPLGDEAWVAEGSTVKHSKYFDVLAESVDTFRLADPTSTCGAVSRATAETRAGLDSDILFEKPVEVNVFMVGGQLGRGDERRVLSLLEESYEPPVVKTGEKAGVRYTYEYNFLYPTTHINAMFYDHMRETAVPRVPNGLEMRSMCELMPERLGPELHSRCTLAPGELDRGVREKVPFYRVNATSVEEFLHEKFAEFLVPGSANLFFLYTDPEELGGGHNYFVTTADKSTGAESTALGMMGYGGNHNLHFFDLMAVPWVEAEAGDLIIPPYKETLHKCSEQSCAGDLMAFHIGSALRHIVTPAYQFMPDYAGNYLFDVVAYGSGSQENRIQTLATKSLNVTAVHGEIRDLHPFSDVEVTLSVENPNSRGIPYDFKKELDRRNIVEYERDGETYKAVLLESGKLQPHLLDWAGERREMRDEDGSARTVPLLLALGSQDEYDTYIDEPGTESIVPEMRFEVGVPCCAIAVIPERVTGANYGVSDLALREIGQVLGLPPTFRAWDEAHNPVVNRYFNWYSSPMTDYGPGSGCEFLNLQLDQRFSDGPCGIASASFTEFEKEHIGVGVLASLIRKTMQNLDEFGGLHPSGEGEADSVRETLRDAIRLARDGDVRSGDGAIRTAAGAYERSLDLLSSYPDADAAPARTPDPPAAEPAAPVSVPGWVKNTAGWWAGGQISDGDFVAAIQYLINAGAISVDASAPADQPAGQIPSWVKNTAKWWAEGQISDGDFVAALEYLIGAGIIRV